MTREEQGRTETARILGAKFALTSAASMVAEGCTYPIDFTKTRLQLQGETGFPDGLRFFPMARRIVSTEGFLGLYSGFTPALARHLPYTGFRAIGYEVRAAAMQKVPCIAPACAHPHENVPPTRAAHSRDDWWR